MDVACLLPPEESVAHDAEVDELGGGHEVDEPLQHDGGVVRDLEEGEKRNGERKPDGVDRDSVPRAAREDVRSFAFQCETEQRAGSAVHVAVPGRESRCQNH